MSQLVVPLGFTSFMTGVPCLSEPDAAARQGNFGRFLLRAVVLTVVAAFALSLAGQPRSFGDPDSSRFGVPAVAHAEMVAFETGLSDCSAVAPSASEVDDGAGDPRAVETTANAILRLSATGFRPLGGAWLPTRDLLPPDRPPRNV